MYAFSAQPLFISGGVDAFLPSCVAPYRRNRTFPRARWCDQSPLALRGAAEHEDDAIAPATSSSNRSSTGAVTRFLGKGENAIVRKGAVLVAPVHEYHHFYRNSAIFIQDMGENEEGLYVIRGLIIDHPTPFPLEVREL